MLGIVLVLEGALRLGVSLRLPGLTNPDWYADWTRDEDYWKLRHLWVSRVAPADNPHWDAALGWSESDLKKAYKNYPESTKSRASILFVGDSFVRGDGPNEERIPTRLARAFPEVNVFNLGEKAYGWDQIYLKAQQSRPQLGKPVVVAGLLTLGLDRSLLKFRTGLKPYLAIEGDELQFKGRPVEKNPDRWLAQNPPTLSPYLLTLAKSQFQRLGEPRLLERTAGQDEKQAVGRLFLKHWAEEAKAVGYPLVVVIFYDRQEMQYPGWREAFLKKELTKLSLPYVDSKDVFRKAVAVKKESATKFYTSAGLLTAEGNALVAEELGKVVARYMPSRSEGAVH